MSKGGYVDGFVIPIPRKNLATYRKMAEWGKRAWMRHGALAYFECVGDDMKAMECPGADGKMMRMSMPFPDMARAKKGETVMFSFIVFKSKAHRNAVNRSVMREMMKDPKNKDMKMPFNPKRMAYGGFRAIVKA